MLEEVGGAVVLGGFVSGASIDPYANGGGFTVSTFGRDAQAVLWRAYLRCWGISYRVGKLLNAEEKDLVNCFPEAELVKFRLKVCIALCVRINNYGKVNKTCRCKSSARKVFL